MRRAGIQHAVLTHSHSDWTERVLTKKNLIEFFNKKHIFGLEKMGYRKKSDGVESFQKTLDIMGFKPEEVLFVDDVPKNLTPAKALGIHTVLISEQLDKSAADADAVFASPLAFMLDFNRERVRAGNVSCSISNQNRSK